MCLIHGRVCKFKRKVRGLLKKRWRINKCGVNNHQHRISGIRGNRLFPLELLSIQTTHILLCVYFHTCKTFLLPYELFMCSLGGQFTQRYLCTHRFSNKWALLVFRGRTKSFESIEPILIKMYLISIVEIYWNHFALYSPKSESLAISLIRL